MGGAAVAHLSRTDVAAQTDGDGEQGEAVRPGRLVHCFMVPLLFSPL